LGKRTAAECFQTWALIDEQSPEFFFVHGQLALAMKDFEEAGIGLSAVCELQPKVRTLSSSDVDIVCTNGSGGMSAGEGEARDSC
jgi:hypothetical protein